MEQKHTGSRGRMALLVAVPGLLAAACLLAELTACDPRDGDPGDDTGSLAADGPKMDIDGGASVPGSPPASTTGGADLVIADIAVSDLRAGAPFVLTLESAYEGADVDGAVLYLEGADSYTRVGGMLLYETLALTGAIPAEESMRGQPLTVNLALVTSGGEVGPYTSRELLVSDAALQTIASSLEHVVFEGERVHDEGLPEVSVETNSPQIIGVSAESDLAAGQIFVTALDANLSSSDATRLLVAVPGGTTYKEIPVSAVSSGSRLLPDDDALLLSVRATTAAYLEAADDVVFLYALGTPTTVGVFRPFAFHTTGSLSDDQWITCLDDSFLQDVQPTADGGFLVAGESWAEDGGLVVRLDGEGGLVDRWVFPAGCSAGCLFDSVQEVSDGGFVAAGYLTQYPDGDGFEDAWVVRVDGDGEEVWNNTYRSGDSVTDLALALEQTSDGGLVFGGGAGEAGWLVKLDGSGDQLWEASFDEEYRIRAVHQTSDGGFALAGDSGVLRLDTDAQVLWRQSDDRQFPDDLAVVPDGFVVLGTRSGARTVWKLDEDGETVWQTPIDESFGGHCSLYSITSTFDGGSVVAGCVLGGEGLISRLDPHGIEVWRRRIAWDDLFDTACSDDEPTVLINSVRQTSRGGFVVAGYQVCNARIGQSFVALLDENGDIVLP